MRINFKFYTKGRFSRFLALWGVFFLILFHCGYAHTGDIIFNEEQPPVAPVLKDSISGQGKEFSVITIQGSTITLISDKVIEVGFRGLENAAMLYIREAETSWSVNLIFSGLAPSATFTIREDGMEKNNMLSSAKGEITFSQDVSNPHNLLIHSAKSTVYIRPDGSIDPPTAPITSYLSGTYFLLGNDLNEPLVIQRNNLSFNGDGHFIIGSGQTLGLDISGRSGVSVWNVIVKGFQIGASFNNATNGGLRNSSIIENTRLGVTQAGGHDNVYYGNTVKNLDPYADQMAFSYSYNNLVNGNILGGATYPKYSWGIDLWRVANSTFSYNQISHTNNSMRFGSRCFGNVVSFSTFTNNNWMPFYWGGNIIKNNLFEWNWVGMRLVSIYDPYYSSFPGNGGPNIVKENIIRFSQSTGINSEGQNAVIEKNSIKSNRRGVVLSRPSFVSDGNNVIEGNDFANNQYADITLQEDPRNEKIRKNTFKDSRRPAILFFSGSGNTVNDNFISGASYGIYMAGGNDNLISGNTVKNSDMGMYLGSPLIKGNTIYHNNFVNNSAQVGLVSAGQNFWNMSYSTTGGGNYYSDYIPPAHSDVAAGPRQNLLPPYTIPDNIVDSSRTFGLNNIDQYPFKLEDGWAKPIAGANPDFNQIAVSTDVSAVTVLSNVPGIGVTLSAPTTDQIQLALSTGAVIVGSVYIVPKTTFGAAGGILSFVCPNFNCTGLKILDLSKTPPTELFDQSIDTAKGTITAIKIPSFASAFALVKPLDSLPPRTTLNIGTPKVPDTTTFISSTTLLSFTTLDDATTVGDGAGVGVDQTKFAIDSGPFSVFTTPFTIAAEGSHTVSFFSTDNAGNTEVVKSSSVAVDITPPITQVVVSTPIFFAVDGSTFITSASQIGFSAQDSVSAGVAAGVAVTRFRIDGGAFTAFTTPFTLSEGAHLVEFQTADNLGNLESLKSITLRVDNTPPIAQLVIQDFQQVIGGTLFVSTDALFGLTAQDPASNGVASGVKQILFSVDGGPFNVFAASFTLPSGSHTLAFRSSDNVGNLEGVKTSNFTVRPRDTLPPRTTLNIGQPQFGADPVFISSTTLLSLSAVDDAATVGDGAGFGVTETRFAVNSGSFAVFVASFTIVAEGSHTVSFFSFDLIGNTETVKTRNLAADNTPPQTFLTVDGATVPAGPVTASENSFFGFMAQDPVSDGVASGIKQTEFGVDSGSFGVFTSTFSLSLGTHTVAFRSRDNVENLEGLKTVAVTVVPPRAVFLDFDPDTLNLKSQGRWVSAFIEAVGLRTAADIDTATLRVAQINDQPVSSSIFVDPEGPVSIGDKDLDGIPDLMVKFDRAQFIAVLPVEEQVKVTVAGSFGDGQTFETEDFIRTIRPGAIPARFGGSVSHPSMAKVDIPSGALSSDTGVTVVRISAAPAGEEQPRDQAARNSRIKRMGTPFEFGPDGIRFNTPVTLTLSYDTLNLAGVREEGLRIAYWNPGTRTWEPLSSMINRANRTVSARTTHFSLYQVVSIEEQAAAVFGLGQVYAFPNPAKGGVNPTIHVEAGQADSLDINIYDVSGELVKSVRITDPPQLIDDGSGRGAQYAFEWAWDVSGAGSGIYIYAVTAYKNGQGSAKAVKKVGVIK